MLNIIQRILSRENNSLASFSVQELNGKSPGVLYSKIGSISHMFDFYYVKRGFVHNINYYYYNNAEVRLRLKEIVDTTANKRGVTPREYLLIAEYLGLRPDYDTYCDVVNEWMNYKGYFFYEDIITSDLPERLPSGFDDMVGRMRANTYALINSEEVAQAGAIYADLYVINGKVCLITGNGKSDACKAIADKCLAYDLVQFINGESGLSCKWCADTAYITVDFCVHMDWVDFDEIREVDCYEYLQKARGNITYCGTSVGSFYHVLKRSKCKMIIVPYTNTLEKKSRILKEYLCKE